MNIHEAANADQNEAEHDDPSRPHPLHQRRGHERHRELNQAIGNHGESDFAGIVAVQLGKIVRHQEHHAEHHRAKGELHEAREPKIITAEQPQIDERRGGAQLDHDEQQKAGRGEDRGLNDER
ncbi:hypothetical protein chiPu_0032617, partial [Chiloscyllium punctatum]|nr:hypothetical protein [Chiloscyllium punctatum]